MRSHLPACSIGLGGPFVFRRLYQIAAYKARDYEAHGVLVALHASAYDSANTITLSSSANVIIRDLSGFKCTP
jgi:hypothetical protein